MTKKDKCVVDESINHSSARLPKKEWDYLVENEWLTKEQVKFLKKAEKLGYDVDIRPKGRMMSNFVKSGNFSWSVSEVVISKTLNNELKK